MANRFAGRNWQTQREEEVADRRGLEIAARTAWADWLEREISPTVFGTLTFRPRANRDVSDASAEGAYARFLVHASTLLGCEVRGVVANEHTKAGAPHGHPLLGISRPHRAGDAHLLERAWKRSHRRAGRTRFERPRSSAATGRYVSKYIVKEGAGLVFTDQLRG